MDLWVVGGVMAAIGGFIAFAMWREAKRTQAWHLVAQELGYEFSKDAKPLELPGAGVFRVFSHGHGRSVRNVSTGSEGPAQVTLCDYQYTTGSGKNSRVHYLTLCLVDTPEIGVTTCLARPQSRFFRRPRQALRRPGPRLWRRPRVQRSLRAPGP